jgi:hypothetical protein
MKGLCGMLRAFQRLHMILLRSLSLILVTSFMSVAVYAQDINAVWTDLRDLHPTQYSVGKIEVERKEEKIDDMSDKERKQFLIDNPIPTVRGYDGDLYLIDHHHLASAILEAGFDHAYVKVIPPDLTKLNEPDFWKEMERLKYVYLRDDDGKVISYKDLPRKLKDLKDDKYRSLAGAVREAGGYQKVNVPFTEFLWAEFFRQRIDFDNSEKGIKKVLDDALKLAHSQEASQLPGYTAGPLCSPIFK